MIFLQQRLPFVWTCQRANSLHFMLQIEVDITGVHWSFPLVSFSFIYSGSSGSDKWIQLANSSFNHIQLSELTSIHSNNANSPREVEQLYSTRLINLPSGLSVSRESFEKKEEKKKKRKERKETVVNSNWPKFAVMKSSSGSMNRSGAMCFNLPIERN